MTQTTSATTGAGEIEKLIESLNRQHRAMQDTGFPERPTIWGETRDALAALREENSRLRKALERIERWRGEFPPTGLTWPDGSPMSYGAAYGSNGERDFMREVARAALSEKPASHARESVQDAQNAISRERAARARADADRTTCSGYEDPEDRCPRKPSECICWQDRTTDSAEKPAAEKEVG